MLNSRRRFVGSFVALALVAGVGATLAAPAVGGPQPLTLAQAKKVFLKKKKAQKTYLTKSSAATTYLSKAGAAATYLPRTGETRVAVPTDSWRLVSNTDDLNITVLPTVTNVSASSPNTTNVDLLAAVPVTTALGGAATAVVGLEVCYFFNDTALDKPVLDRMALQSVRPGAAVTPGLTTLRSDETGRVDNACTTFRFEPVPLQPNETPGIGLRFDFPDANAAVRIGVASLILTT